MMTLFRDSCGRRWDLWSAVFPPLSLDSLSRRLSRTDSLPLFEDLDAECQTRPGLALAHYRRCQSDSAKTRRDFGGSPLQKDLEKYPRS